MILEQIKDVPDEAAVLLDVPVGTGRFFPFYKEYGFKPTGVDISDDMLSEAAGKAKDLGIEVELLNGSIEQLNFDEDSFVTVVCIRILNWVDFHALCRIFSELSRVASDNIVVGIRVSEWERRGLIGSTVQFTSFWGLASYRAIKAQLRPGLLKIHRESKVLKLFAKHNLTVQARIQIESSPLHSSYYVYHLIRRKSDKPSALIHEEID